MNDTIINTYFEYLGTGKIPELFGLFAENVQWHQPGKNKFSGTKSGVEEIGQMIGGMMEESNGTLQVKLASNVMVNGEFVSAPITFSARKDNTDIKMSGLDLFKVENGKITEVWLFSDDEVTEDKFWGN